MDESLRWDVGDCGPDAYTTVVTSTWTFEWKPWPKPSRFYRKRHRRMAGK